MKNYRKMTNPKPTNKNKESKKSSATRSPKIKLLVSRARKSYQLPITSHKLVLPLYFGWQIRVILEKVRESRKILWPFKGHWQNVTALILIGVLITSGLFIFNSLKIFAVTLPYDFSTGAETNKWAYEKGNAQPANPADYESEATSGDYTAISSSDDSRWATALADEGESDSQIYTFNINEGVEYISQISAEWQGYGETASGYLTYLKIWNKSSQEWEQLDSKDFTSATDATLSGSKTTNISNYIDDNSKAHVLATTKKLGPKRVFVTSLGYTADLKTAGGGTDGIDGADKICQARANAGGLGGNWTAWISSSTISAASRVTHWSFGYELLDGTKVADSWTDLTDGSLDHAIDMNEHGTGGQSMNVWTNTKKNGTIFGSGGTYYHCHNWTYGVSSEWGAEGHCASTNAGWTEGIGKWCGLSYRLYCFED